MNPSGELTSQISATGVRSITFGHPAHNSFPASQLIALVAAISAAGDDEDTRCILLRSMGEKTFCAGANLDELLAITNEQEAKRFFMGFGQVLLAMRACPKPIVVAVQGKAIGGGVGIAAAADYCLATRAASIRLSELAIAIGPFVILPALQRKMGLAATSEMALDTAWHSAEWAQQKGLYQQLYDTPDALFTAAGVLANQLAGHSPQATAALKRALWEGTRNWTYLLEERAEMSGRLVLTEPAKAALAEFKKK